jgi:hypothetical protein
LDVTTKQQLSFALIAFVALSCGQNYSEKQVDAALVEKNLTPIGVSAAATKAPTAVRAPVGGGNAGAADVQQWQGVLTEVPAGWQAEKPTSSMRIAQYSVPAVHGGTSAGLAVFAGNMGSVDDNVDRWIGQFSQGKGGDSGAQARRWVLQSDGGLEATLVDAAGTYSGGMSTGGGAVEQYRLLGAIVHTGSTFLYLKLTGPEVEVAELSESFEQMVRSMRAG